MTDAEIDKYIEELEPYLQKSAEKNKDSDFVEWAKNYIRNVLKNKDKEVKGGQTKGLQKWS